MDPFCRSLTLPLFSDEGERGRLDSLRGLTSLQCNCDMLRSLPPSRCAALKKLSTGYNADAVVRCRSLVDLTVTGVCLADIVGPPPPVSAPTVELFGRLKRLCLNACTAAAGELALLASWCSSVERLKIIFGDVDGSEIAPMVSAIPRGPGGVCALAKLSLWGLPCVPPETIRHIAASCPGSVRTISLKDARISDELALVLFESLHFPSSRCAVTKIDLRSARWVSDATVRRLAALAGRKCTGDATGGRRAPRCVVDLGGTDATYATADAVLSGCDVRALVTVGQSE
jgi:hypothetical protein